MKKDALHGSVLCLSRSLSLSSLQEQEQEQEQSGYGVCSVFFSVFFSVAEERIIFFLRLGLVHKNMYTKISAQKLETNLNLASLSKP
jgi:hypothetical protein